MERPAAGGKTFEAIDARLGDVIRAHHLFSVAAAPHPCPMGPRMDMVE